MPTTTVEFIRDGMVVCEERVEVPAGREPRFAVISALLRHNFAPSREGRTAVEWDAVKVDGNPFGQKLPKTRDDYLCGPDFGVMLTERIKAMRAGEDSEKDAA